MATATTSQAPMPAKALKKYADKWVAIRDGRIVAHADTLPALLGNNRVRRGDAYYRVPSSTTLYY